MSEVPFHPLAVINLQLDQSKTVLLHPLIDYHEEIGFSIGTLIDSVPEMAKINLIILADSVFLTDFETTEIPERFPKKARLKKVRWLDIRREWSYAILLLSKELAEKAENIFPSKEEAFQKTLEILKNYWYHSDPRYYTLVTCWIIGTYFHPIFSFYPALNVQGQRETGKSTLLDILSKTCWNPTGRETAIRGADIFRTVEGTKGTYIIDITKFNLNNDDTKDVVDLIEVGTEKGGVVRRINKDTLKPQEFEVYSPKAIATRYELPFTVKCIRILTERAPKEYSQKRAQLPFDPQFKEIINLLVRATVKYWREIVQAYKSMQQTDKLTGRAFNYWAPILAVCKVFNPEGYNELLGLAEEYATSQKASDKLSEVEAALLAVLTEYSQPTTTILLKTLTEKVQNIVPWVQSWHIVKSALQNLRITLRTYETSQGVTYQIDLQKAREKAKQKGIIQADETEENQDPYFKHCYFCGKPIFTDDWRADEYTENKPTHADCYRRITEQMKKDSTSNYVSSP